MKLDTVMDIRQSAECKNHNSITSNYRVISLPNFCNSKIAWSLSLKVLKINK